MTFVFHGSFPIFEYLNHLYICQFDNAFSPNAAYNMPCVSEDGLPSLQQNLMKTFSCITCLKYHKTQSTFSLKSLRYVNDTTQNVIHKANHSQISPPS
jgi:hypothetical protein